MEKNQTNIFSRHKHWSFSQNEEKVEQKINMIANSTIKSLSPSFYSIKMLENLSDIKQKQLYNILSNMPKGVMHHNHIECNIDFQFIAKYIANDSRVHINQDNNFILTNKEQADKQGWRTLTQFKQAFKNDRQFQQYLVRKFQFTKEQYNKIQEIDNAWNQFSIKIQNFFPFIWAEHIFKPYLIHVFRKYALNMYQRVQFRAFIVQLSRYDQNGLLISKLPYSRYIQLFQQAVQQVQKQFPHFQVSIIYEGLKCFSDEVNLKYLKDILNLNWDRAVGIDFVNQQDANLQVSHFDKLAQSSFQQYRKQQGRIRLVKVYHAGQSRSPSNNNIESALNSGTVRIGHGFNLVNHLGLLQRAKSVCFQLCPVSNVVLGYFDDPRQGPAPLLLHLGIPLTINPDDPGIFGYQDTTVDFFVALVSYNWTIRHLKLTFLYSIDFALCDEQTKSKMRDNFKSRWNKWINQLK